MVGFYNLFGHSQGEIDAMVAELTGLNGELSKDDASGSPKSATDISKELSAFEKKFSKFSAKERRSCLEAYIKSLNSDDWEMSDIEIGACATDQELIANFVNKIATTNYDDNQLKKSLLGKLGYQLDLYKMLTADRKKEVIRNIVFAGLLSTALLVYFIPFTYQRAANVLTTVKAEIAKFLSSEAAVSLSASSTAKLAAAQANLTNLIHSLLHKVASAETLAAMSTKWAGIKTAVYSAIPTASMPAGLNNLLLLVDTQFKAANSTVMAITAKYPTAANAAKIICEAMAVVTPASFAFAGYQKYKALNKTEENLNSLDKLAIGPYKKDLRPPKKK
jgi:hypothetical protein